MSIITTRENIEEAPVLRQGVAPLTRTDMATTQGLGWSITRAITLAKCLRCGFEWLPRVENPVKCPHCKTPLWNVERAQQLPGKPAPTRKGKPRGRALVAGDPRHSSNQKKQGDQT